MKKLIPALIKFQQEVGPIHKESSAQYGKFADLATVLATVTPVLNSNGLCVTQVVNGEVLETILWHESGESLIAATDLVLTGGRGNALHTWGGAITYQKRYSLLSLLGLATEDDDGDSQGSRISKSATISNDDFL
ncbi:MAG: ERF family protein [Synechococcus sp.]